jgi:hypothetical protein
MEVTMNFRNTTIFLAVFFLTAWNINAQEQPDTDETIDAPVVFLNFQPIPGFNIFGHNFQKTTDIFLIGTIVGYGYKLTGIGSASLGIINSGRVQGVQLSGIFNIANSGMDGFQTASIFNVAKGSVRGAQFSGIYNYASGTFMGLQLSGILNRIDGDMWGLQVGPINSRGEGGGVGVQVGFLNFSDSGNVIPIGFVNKVKDGMEHFWIYTDDMLFLNAGYRSGSKIFYTHSNIGIGGELMGREGGKLMVKRGGFGFEFPISKLFIDIDVSTGNIFKVDELEDFWNFFFGTNTSIYQLRLIVGYKMYERFGIFAGISYDYMQQTKDTDPSPQEFAGSGISYDGNTHKMGFFGGLQF